MNYLTPPVHFTSLFLLSVTYFTLPSKVKMKCHPNTRMSDQIQALTFLVFSRDLEEERDQVLISN